MKPVRMRPVLAAILLLAVTARASLDDGVTLFGPMVHYNFGGSDRSGWSFAIEVSRWKGLVGIDGGVEIDLRRQVRIYGEVEAGVVVAGAAAGPVLQFGNGGFRGGMQVSLWANYFAGADFRIRKFAGAPVEMAPGAYLKLMAVGTAGGDAGEHHGIFDD